MAVEMLRGPDHMAMRISDMDFTTEIAEFAEKQLIYISGGGRR
jgi:hypothetical protein